MKIVIVKYNAGNVYSVESALLRFGIQPVISDVEDEIKSADKVIFPGVGEARTAMAYLQSNGLSNLFRDLKQPFLGICLGLQLMCTHSQEKDTPCLDIFPAEVKLFPATYKVPHIGWNALEDLKGPLFKKIAEGSYVYFVHSYYAEVTDLTTASSKYSLPFSAAMQKDNFFAVQFHPEKSAETGAQILKNFIDM
jgi:imidazole glycerol-phosphate synthase subunit HisH